MKSSIKKDTFKAIYRLLDRVSPIDGDCGKLCGSICCTYGNEDSCTGSEDALGLYLLPGEEKLFDRNEDWLDWDWEYAEDYEFPDSWHGKVYFLKCKNAPFCDRKLRPLQCRIFPVTPHIDEDGDLCLIYQDIPLPYSCPLITGHISLNEDFLKATHTVWKHLIREPLIYDLVMMDSVFRLEDGTDITVVYPHP